MTESDPLVIENKASASLEAWRLVRSMLDNLTKMIQEDFETEIELLEGLRVLARATALCSELSVDVDYERPYFFSMNTRMRYIGGPNPDGEYHLGMIDGERRYRIRGLRGTACYLGFQVLAGRGLMPRRMAAYVSDRDLRLHAEGRSRSFWRERSRPPSSSAARPGCRSRAMPPPLWCASTSRIVPRRSPRRTVSSRSTRPARPCCRLTR